MSLVVVLVMVLAVVVVAAGVDPAWADGPSQKPPPPQNPLSEVLGGVRPAGLVLLGSIVVGFVLTLIKLLAWAAR
jgi:hypothetical protein